MQSVHNCNPNAKANNYKLIVLDVMLCSITEYFYELCRNLTSS